MSSIRKQEVEGLILSLSNDLGRCANKKDIENCGYLPSYGTCLRIGIKLSTLKEKFYHSKPTRCKYCITTIPFKKRKNLFCSSKCSSDFNYTSKMTCWLNTGVCDDNKTLRRYLKTIHGYKCSVCGLSDWNTLPITLEVEHKNGNSQDSSLENVCLICPNCHSQTSTFKGRNKGNGRHKRRIRYHEGKSY
jgi:hypothetical protein